MLKVVGFVFFLDTLYNDSHSYSKRERTLIRFSTEVQIRHLSLSVRLSICLSVTVVYYVKTNSSK